MYVQIYYPKSACVAWWGSRKTFLKLKKKKVKLSNSICPLPKRDPLVCVQLVLLCAGRWFAWESSSKWRWGWMLWALLHGELIGHYIMNSYLQILFCAHCLQSSRKEYQMLLCGRGRHPSLRHEWGYPKPVVRVFGMGCLFPKSGQVINSDTTITKSREEALTLNNGHEKTRHSTLLFLSEPFATRVCNLKASHTHLQLTGPLLWRLEDTNQEMG